MLRASEKINLKGLKGDEALGANILKTALEGPMRQLVSNAGLEASVIVNEVKSNKSRGIINNQINKEKIISIPLVGKIAAGEPLEIPEDIGINYEEEIEIPIDWFPKNKNIFALEVKGTDRPAPAPRAVPRNLRRSGFVFMRFFFC